MSRPLATAYVAIGEAGLLKVGYTRNFKRRLLSLRKEFKAKGDALKHAHLCAAIEAAYSVECSLIAFCAKTLTQHSGREWFIGGIFADVVAEAERLTDKWKKHRYPRPLTPEERAALDAKYEAARLARAEATAKHKAFLAQRKRINLLKRTRAERALQPLVEFALRQVA